ncbi:MAG: ACP S-malonyltransferase, partial [Myxococcales bacterium]|nr:ACP S-malonyltransferase [Myxococcales bacterium]
QPIAEDDLREVVEAAGKLGPVEIVNLNSPRQHVIAGEQAAVEAAVELAEDEHFAQTHIIDRNVPMHSSLFVPVGERFADYLRTLSFTAPRRPYLPNRLATFIDQPGPADFVELLSSHVHAPVRWRESVEAATAANPDTVFVEVGPMAVLHNLIHRKWLGNRKYRLDAREDFEAHFAAVVSSLREHG